jgi:hypothetical protein
MRDQPLPDDATVFEATKTASTLELQRDPHPETTRYLVVEGPGLLVLFPKDGDISRPAPIERVDELGVPGPPDRDGHIRRAFVDLASRVRPSAWTTSNTPYTDLTETLRTLAADPAVAADVAAYLAENPAVENAVEMLFTAISMSARAQWDAAPTAIRGVVARGWFLGRWLPTFLVLDGPILRFLNGPAFRRHDGSAPLLRSVRAFFETRDFMLLRHCLAHWSFSWVVDNDDSAVVGYGKSASETVRATRLEADAFHIVTFALVEALDEVFIRSHRSKIRSTTP